MAEATASPEFTAPATDYVSSYDHDAPRPKVGSRWVWEIDQPHARTLVEVTEVVWNGEEWWVTTVDLPTETLIGETPRPGRESWNDVGRFWEAVTPIGGGTVDLLDLTRP